MNADAPATQQSVEGWIDPSLLLERSRREQLALFAKNAPTATVAAVINVAVIGYVMRGAVESWILVSWVAGQIALNLARFLAIQVYTRRMSESTNTRAWARWVSVGIVVQALGWSVAGAVLFPAGSPMARTFIAVLLAGMVSGGVSVMSSVRVAASAWVILLVLPLTVACFQLADLWPLLGVITILFQLTQLSAVQHAYARFMTLVEMDLRNQALVASLSRSNHELEQARDTAMTAAKIKADFLANMSHEIRTPMTSILGFADLIREAKSEEEIDEHSAAIQRNGEHLLALINDILDLSKIEAGKLSVDLVTASPKAIILSAVDMLREAARTRDLTLSCRLGDPFPRKIRTDPIRLRQILVNLLSNATKFTAAGEVRVDSGVDRKGDHGWLVIHVSDTGIGMSPEQLSHVFQPFTQADTGISRRYGGTGLGLSISRQLALLLGGTLEATSTPGQGSCFTLSLDIGNWDDIELGAPDLDTTPQSPPTARPRATPQFSGSVLVAEDGRDNQRLIRILLEKRGLEVALAENGRAALECVRRANDDRAPFDLVLMDIQMPEMDGCTATRTLKTQGLTTPIVALTAQVLEEDRARFMTAGFDGYLSKPISTAALDEMLARFLERRVPDAP